MSGAGGRSPASRGTLRSDETRARAAAPATCVSGASRSIAWHAHRISIATTRVASSTRARGLERRAHAHADVVFPVRRRRNRVDAGRMRERLHLRGQRRGGHLRHHVARLQAAVAGQERRQVAERRIDQPIGSPLADRRELHERDGEQVGGDRDRRAVKVAAGDDVAVVGEDHRVVGRAVGFDRRASSRTKRSASRAAPCTCARAAQRVGVLHRAAVLVRLVDGAAAQQAADVGRRRRAGRGAAARRGCAPRTGASIRAARRSRARRRCRRRARAVRRRRARARRPRSTAACR